jgi:uncharacterized protein
MRLSPEESMNIVSVFMALSAGKPHKVYLFGSRADDLKRGGDIDLLCIVDDSNVEWLQMKKFELLTAIKEKIGDQKIDIVIRGESAAQNEPFAASILPSSILLSDVK